MKLKIYHNTRCSKSRATLQILKDKNIDHEVITYLDNPPSADELSNILTMLGFNPQDLMRKNQAEYKSSGLDNENLGREEQIELMIANPIVIERPIVVFKGKAIIGRPPENILDII